MSIEQAREAAHTLRTHTHPNILSIDRAVMIAGAEAIDALIAEVERMKSQALLDQIAYSNRVTERDALKADAELYRWLVDNNKSWTWKPSRYNADTVSGFAAYDTGYLGYGFDDAVKIAMKGKS